MTLKLKDIPDHHDAELVMRLYALRTDALMRESRTLISREYWPTTIDEAMAVTTSTHPLNAAYRQVTSYWEMAYGMVKHGILHGDYMLESNGEGLFVFAKLKPFIMEMRARTSPRLMHNTEWISSHSAYGAELMARMDKSIAGALAALAAKK